MFLSPILKSPPLRYYGDIEYFPPPFFFFFFSCWILWSSKKERLWCSFFMFPSSSLHRSYCKFLSSYKHIFPEWRLCLSFNRFAGTDPVVFCSNFATEKKKKNYICEAEPTTVVLSNHNKERTKRLDVSHPFR